MCVAAILFPYDVILAGPALIDPEASWHIAFDISGMSLFSTTDVNIYSSTFPVSPLVICTTALNFD